MNEDEKLLADLNCLLKTNPSADLVLARGLTLRRLQYLNEAIADFDLLVYHGFDEAIKYRGECHLKKGVFAKGEVDLQKSLELFPSDPFTLRHLGELYRQLGHWHKATQFFSKSLLFDSDNVFALSGLADCCRVLDQSDRAFNLFNLALKHDPFHSQALAGRAAIYLERGETELAQLDYQVALMEDPSNEFAQEGFKKAMSIQETPTDLLGNSNPVSRLSST